MLAIVAVTALFAVLYLIVGRTAPPPAVEVVAVFPIEGGRDVNDRDARTTTGALIALLSRVNKIGPTRRLDVKSLEKIQIEAERSKQPLIEAARNLGVRKKIHGTLDRDQDDLRVHIEIVETDTGDVVGTVEDSARDEEIIDLQNRTALAVLRELDIELSGRETSALVAGRTNQSLELRNLAADTLPGATPSNPAPEPKPVAPRSSEESSRWWDVAVAAAQAEPSDAEAIDTLLERYRTALEAEDVDKLAELHVELTETQRAALRRYFDRVANLSIRIADTDVTVAGNEALAAFTRVDSFTDMRTGRSFDVDLPTSMFLVKTDAGWRIAGLKDQGRRTATP